MLGLFKAVRDYKPGKEASFATFAGLCIDRQMYTAVASSQRQKHQPLNSIISISERVDTGGDHDQTGKRKRHA